MLIDLYSKTRPSYRIAMMAAMASIAVIASYTWLINPHVKYLEAAKKYAGVVSDLTEKTKILESKLKIKQIENKKLLQQLSESQDGFFTASDAQQFFAGFDAFAKQSNCSVVSLNQLPEEGPSEKNAIAADSGFTAYHASVDIIGGYSDIVRFLTKLLDYSNKIVISRFSLCDHKDAAQNLECSLVLTIYVIDKNSKGADPNAK